MLPAELLSVARRGGRATPRYLSARDEVWVRSLLDRADAFVGRAAGDRDRALPGLGAALAAEHGVREVTALGVLRVVSRRYSAEILAPAPPPRIREVVFEEAARGDVLDRAGVLERAAARLGVPAASIEPALFADRPVERLLVAPPAPLAPAEIVETYNLSLAQGLLLRSERVLVDVREHVRAVVRFAKLARLICAVSRGPRGARLELSGPLSILRHTTKYGLALARFLPAAAATPGFRLEARCVLFGEPVAVDISATDRIARRHALPRDADSALERALAKDLRRLGSPFELVREARVIEAAGRLVFPDFTLRRGDDEVLVEIVGFYTPVYLAAKLEALRAVALEAPLVVCVDASLPCGAAEVPGEMVPFRRRVDAAALLAAAERALARSRPRSAAPR